MVVEKKSDCHKHLWMGAGLLSVAVVPVVTIKCNTAVALVLSLLSVVAYVSSACCVNRSDTTDDERAFELMRHHALPAEPTSRGDIYRCPECGMSFDVSNAAPVEDAVVLCPFCATRLMIRGQSGGSIHG
ncbi:MAG: hypothetical protein ACTSYX_11555 [Candidatus Thorarchaeota archaeon]